MQTDFFSREEITHLNLAFLNTHQKNGWVNLNVLTSQAGKPYVELDTFVPKKQGDAPVKVEEKTADLPF